MNIEEARLTPEEIKLAWFRAEQSLGCMTKYSTNDFDGIYFKEDEVHDKFIANAQLEKAIPIIAQRIFEEIEQRGLWDFSKEYAIENSIDRNLFIGDSEWQELKSKWLKEEKTNGV